MAKLANRRILRIAGRGRGARSRAAAAIDQLHMKHTDMCGPKGKKRVSACPVPKTEKRPVCKLHAGLTKKRATLTNAKGKLRRTRKQPRRRRAAR